ncbi:alpha/beta fold hydrolase [Bordetella petrii]|uniref:Alpha/beta hydrolase n=1 Tax=Bordetella petrii TaxID=94624 RepID=A0ABT7VZA9_9BORD|nr:alpha/beta hydrolase [Bordetella petrii]MDM9558270.1 alpha/beta hydrolase [Bordetella petrii]
MTALITHDAYIDTAQGRLYTRRWTPAADRPDGPAPIVLLHDSLGCVALWRDFPERLALATGRSVIAYDRLGFGQSDPHPGTLDSRFVHQEAHDGFRRLREQLGLERFVLFGHSVGGGMAIVCAAEYGAACQGLVTESAQAFAEEHTLAGIRQARQDFAQPGQLERLQKYHGDKAAWVLSAWVDTWLSPEFAAWNLDGDLRRVRCPVLALHGDHDEYGSLLHPQRIAGLTQGRQAILENCGHVPHREQTDSVLHTIRQWLAEAPGQR